MTRRSRTRIYRDPPDRDRCEADATTVCNGEGARCGRRKVIGPYCRQHAQMIAAANAKALTPRSNQP